MKLLRTYKDDILAWGFFAVIFAIIWSAIEGVGYLRNAELRKTNWEKAPIEYIHWECDEARERDSVQWTVEFVYVVQGRRYTGDNVTLNNKRAVRRKRGGFLEEREYLNSINDIWYDPADPARSFVLKHGIPSIDAIRSEARKKWSENQRKEPAKGP